MKDILDDIIAQKQRELVALKAAVKLGKLVETYEQQTELRNTISMRASLEASPYGIIAEFKRKSPSKGWIKEHSTPEEIPSSYEKNGASALSILTDELFFGGHLDFLKRARPTVTLPILRKDFIIDEYQLYQARLAGADAVLLIAACLSKEECSILAAKAHELQLETLLEIHCEEELDYIGEHIDMVGVNNRNLGSFHTDTENSFRLAKQLPKEYLLISESGIDNPDMVMQLREAGFKGFLIGESFMKTDNPGIALHNFINKLKH